MSIALTTPPNWKSNPSGNNNYVATSSGWMNEDTKEVVVAIGNLAVRQGISTVEKVFLLPAIKTTFKLADVLEIDVTYTQETLITGTPRMPITIGGVSKAALYTSGSGTSDLKFCYTIASADNGALVVISPLSLSGGTIKSKSTTSNLPLTFTPPVTTAVVISGVVPTITSGTLNSGVYTTGQPINLSLVLSKAVSVTGNPSVALSINGVTKQAVYFSGTGSATLVFKYPAVVAGDHAIAGQFSVTSPVVLNGGTIHDSAGNTPALTFTPPNATAVTVN